MANDQQDTQRHYKNVVEVAEQGNEIRDQVDRRQCTPGHEDSQRRVPRHAWVSACQVERDHIALNRSCPSPQSCQHNSAFEAVPGRCQGWKECRGVGLCPISKLSVIGCYRCGHGPPLVLPWSLHLACRSGGRRSRHRLCSRSRLLAPTNEVGAWGLKTADCRSILPRGSMPGWRFYVRDCGQPLIPSGNADRME